MKILVLATDYPDNNENVGSMYIHTRNKHYIANNIEVTVINFKSKENYIIDGIDVVTLNHYENNYEKYDILLSHAPNLRNHYKFFKKHFKNFENVVLFFHGHEVLQISKTYPKPFKFMRKSNIVYGKMRDIYDVLKFKIWKRFIKNNITKLNLIFVSHWIYGKFLENLNIDEEIIKPKQKIIYNSIGKLFEINNHQPSIDKKYDFITIRSNLDGSRYSIDIVTNIAAQNPQYKFCVIGKGKFFKYYNKPENLDWIDKNLSHEEIIKYLNISKYGLLPTRTDTQGVMACEIASFMMPLITSEIDVSNEIFGGFENVAFIDNDDKNINIEPIIQSLLLSITKEKNEKYFAKNTIDREIELFKSMNYLRDSCSIEEI